MNKKYTINHQTTNIKINNEDKKETTIHITKKDESYLKPNEIKNYYDDLIKKLDEKYNDDYLIHVLGLATTQYFTLKPFYDDYLNLEDEDEYLDGKISNNSNFGRFFSLTLKIIH